MWQVVEINLRKNCIDKERERAGSNEEIREKEWEKGK
jgi:hypothetical protein